MRVFSGKAGVGRLKPSAGKPLSVAAGIAVFCACSAGSAMLARAQGKSCEVLRDEIAARLALPKESFRLDIVPKDEATGGKVMGSCEQGSRRIVFHPTAAPEAAPASWAGGAPPGPLASPQPPTATPAPGTANVPAAPAQAAEVARPAADVSAPTSPSASRRRGGPDEATLAQYKKWIGEARDKHPYEDTEERMLSVMLCESGGQAGIVNPAGPYVGLFQYSPGTWRGAWNVYRDDDMQDARAQILATALAWQKRMQGQWGCYKRAH